MKVVLSKRRGWETVRANRFRLPRGKRSEGSDALAAGCEEEPRAAAMKRHRRGLLITFDRQMSMLVHAE